MYFIQGVEPIPSYGGVGCNGFTTLVIVPWFVPPTGAIRSADSKIYLTDSTTFSYNSAQTDAGKTNLGSVYRVCDIPGGRSTSNLTDTHGVYTRGLQTTRVCR